MAHDVFISYSARDKAIADAACATLEAGKIRCWIAPRDVSPGQIWASALVEAIDQSQVFVLVFSDGANRSPQVLREVGEAVENGIPIIPFRVEEVEPSKELGYYINPIHWLDAITPPLEKHLASLAVRVGALLQAGIEAEPLPPRPATEPEQLATPTVAPRAPSRSLPLALIVVVGPIIAALILIWWFGIRPHSGSMSATPTSKPTSLLAAAPTPAWTVTSPLAPTASATATPSLLPSTTPTPKPSRTPADTPSPTVAWISIAQRFTAPGSLAEGIAWDGKHLWLADNSGTLFEVDASGAPLDAFGVPEVTPQGLTWDGSSFWLFTTNYGLIYRFRLEGREPKTISSFKSPARVFGGGITNDLSWDGEALWYANQYNVYRLDTKGDILSSFAFAKNVTGLEWDGTYLWVAYGEPLAPSVIAVLDADGRELASFPSPVQGIEGLAWGDGYMWAIGREDFTGKSTVFKLNVALARAEAHVRSSSSNWQVRVFSARQAYFLQETRPGQTGVGIQPPIQHIAGVGRTFIVVKLGLKNPVAGAILQLKDMAIVDSRGQIYSPSGILIKAAPLPEEYTVGQLEGKVMQSSLKPLELKLLYEVKSISGASTSTTQGDVSLPSLKDEWPELALAWLVPADAGELRLSVPGAPAIDLTKALLVTPTPAPQKQ